MNVTGKGDKIYVFFQTHVISFVDNSFANVSVQLFYDDQKINIEFFSCGTPGLRAKKNDSFDGNGSLPKPLNVNSV
ncbi:hypothetical protein Tph_c08950 [Thermacetogenium phaeum DSM 12270]|uniref:Uncharacterized protein n=1 Tax=Thermacetogenium phaeum (strain ATCC BAA-254 / DSM 26808 / PB) TaxID=1089553 RepID=K4LGM5_THEPS|nr:hypothetical protein Tph_c08950 [Thermacetogenium phaeum DSM 12270]